jgi:uncharacterized surface protein with fasciclin (FAS1) repeats
VLLPLLFAFFALNFSSCEKDMFGKIYQVSDQKMMDEILESKKDSLSSFLKIIDISGLRGTIHAYGAYTLFAPTNEAVDKYLSDRGLTLDKLTDSVAAGIVKYHLVADTIKSSDFVDGRLPMANFSSKFITTQTVADPTGVNVIVNRQGKLMERDLRAGNGYVHIVNSVLSQSAKSIEDVINELPASYSLWKEVYAASGAQTWMDQVTAASPTTVFTCFIQDNDGFASAGITNMESLMTELKLKNPQETDNQKLLLNYVSYHLAFGFKYVVDLMNQSALQTVVSGEVIVLKKRRYKNTAE